MKLLAISAAVSMLALVTGCQSTKFDAAVAQNLPKICDGAAQIHAAFAVVAKTGTVKADVVRKERAAWAAASRVCTSNVNSSTALVIAAEAFADLTAALKAAQ